MKNKIKELAGIIFFSILNILVAYSITTPLGIKDIVLFQSLTATNYIITYEILIWFGMSFIEAFIYEKIAQKKSEA